jgi:hypothetical protein
VGRRGFLETRRSRGRHRADRAGNIYAITSHSRDSAGDERKSRERLVRFRIEGDDVVDPRVVDSLKRELLAAHPELAAAAAIRQVKSEGGLNIEALEMSADQDRLLIGLRSPLVDGRAIIASIENPGAIFDAAERPRIGSTLTTLDLGGHGIRGMCWAPSLAGYVLIAGPVAREQAEFQLSGSGLGAAKIARAGSASPACRVSRMPRGSARRSSMAGNASFWSATTAAARKGVLRGS